MLTNIKQHTLSVKASEKALLHTPTTILTRLNCAEVAVPLCNLDQCLMELFVA